MKSPSFEVEWKGQSLGRFTLAELRTQLASGHLSRIHRVQVQGAWQPLGVWLDQLEAHQRNAAMQAQEQERTGAEHELSAERTRVSALEQRLRQMEQNRPPPIPASPFPTTSYSTPTSSLETTETCGMAIASLVLGILCALLFTASVVLAYQSVPEWLGITFCACILTWFLTIIFGHLALTEIRREPSTSGRGLALTGLILGYLVIVLIAILFIIAASQNDYRRRLHF